MKGGWDVDFKEQYFDIWKTAWDFHKKYSTDRIDWEKATDEAAALAELERRETNR